MNPDHLNRENLLNFQNLTPEEYERLRQRYLELLLFRETLHHAGVGKIKFLECQTEERLPDEYLVAFEAGVDFCKNFLTNSINDIGRAMQNYENQLRESYEDEAYGPDSSDEIERMKEVAKANNYRTKRSKFRPDDVLNA
jgi:hypothetical protein